MSTNFIIFMVWLFLILAILSCIVESFNASQRRVRVLRSEVDRLDRMVAKSTDRYDIMADTLTSKLELAEEKLCLYQDWYDYWIEQVQDPD